MNPHFANRIHRILLAGAAALVLVAPADAQMMRLDDSMVTTYGWGAAAAYAKLHS